MVPVEQKYIDSIEFKDDGKAKVTFVLDRDKLNNREKAIIETPDGSWSQPWYYYTSNSSETYQPEIQLINYFVLW